MVRSRDWDSCASTPTEWSLGPNPRQSSRRCPQAFVFPSIAEFVDRGLFEIAIVIALKHVTRYVDADGKRCEKSTTGAAAVKERSQKWYGRYRDSDGIQRDVALTTRKEAAKRMLGEGCGFRRTADFSTSRVSNWLSDQRDAERLSIATSNDYPGHVKSFATWLVRDQRISSSPLEHLQKLNESVEDKRERRAVSTGDFSRIVEAAQSGSHWRLSGADRAMLYFVAVYTGLRAQELASLTPESFDLDAGTPTVTVQAGYSKRRREDLQPLPGDLIHVLRDWLDLRPDGELLWPGSWWNVAAEMLRKDLDVTGALEKLPAIKSPDSDDHQDNEGELIRATGTDARDRPPPVLVAPNGCTFQRVFVSVSVPW